MYYYSVYVLLLVYVLLFSLCIIISPYYYSIYVLLLVYVLLFSLCIISLCMIISLCIIIQSMYYY